MPDELTQTVALSVNDWQIVRAGLYKLPIEVGLATLQRFEMALAEPQKPERTTPHVVEADHA